MYFPFFLRRGTKPVSSSSKNTDSAHEGTLSSSRPFFGGLKRAAIHENKEITIGENTNKRSKVIGHDMPAETEKGQSRTENMMQKRKSNEIESTHVSLRALIYVFNINEQNILYISLFFFYYLQ